LSPAQRLTVHSQREVLSIQKSPRSSWGEKKRKFKLKEKYDSFEENTKHDPLSQQMTDKMK
jgi:hypothetical protein